MAFSTCLRGRISSPLEAGPAVADGHDLAANVNEALEYVSRRLARKAAHITLLAVRKDYQLPTSPIASPTFTPWPLTISTTNTPSRPTFPTVSRVEALKQLVRPNNSGEGQLRERIVHVHLDQFRNGTASPAFSEASAYSASTASSLSTADSTFSRRMRWPGTPTAYGSVPVTPATPFTAVSSSSGTDGNSVVSRQGSQTSGRFGMKLVYAHPLSSREEKALSLALEKAAKKFKLDPSWLPQAVSPSTLGLPVDLVLKSTAQNESLFSSDHLTLLSLDRLYTFRTALQAYARTNALFRLEDAVDELRRLFLASGRCALRKSALLAAYRWLDPVSDASLADVCRMYERAYGGDGVEKDVDPVPAWPLPGCERDSGDAEQSLARRMGMPAASPGSLEAVAPLDEPRPRFETPGIDWAGSLDKEMLLSGADADFDDGSEFDAIEAWYREVHDHMPIVEIHPLRSHPAVTAAPAVVEIPPSPPPIPLHPPRGPSPSSQGEPRIQLDKAELNEMRRTTPKLRPAPPGRSLALKLQTTFDKPIPGTNKQPITERRGDKAEANRQDNDEEEEELTARPRSAIKTFANARWTATGNNGISIDEMLHGGGRHHGDSGETDTAAGEHVPQQQAEEKIGPMTPNGYDDISPITRGEWGFLMFGKKGKTVKVEMC